MNEEVILSVGNAKFLLSIDEAMAVARVLNSACRIETAWIQGTPSEQSHVRKPPSYAVANIAPMTALLAMEMETNMKALGEKK